MYKRQRLLSRERNFVSINASLSVDFLGQCASETLGGCLLYTSDAADERSSVDLGGRRIIKKKKTLRVIPKTTDMHILHLNTTSH